MQGVAEEIRMAVTQAMAAQRDLDYRVWQGRIKHAEYEQERAAAIAQAVSDLSWLLDRR